MPNTERPPRVQQAARILTGHCPKCGRAIVVLNDHESWPLVSCKCGWIDATTALEHGHRTEDFC